MSRETIAFDLDDVIADNAKGFIEFTNNRWGTNLSIEDYSEHWAEVWQVDHDEVMPRAHEFYASGTVKTYDQIDGAKVVLQGLSEQYRLIIITSRHRSMMDDTLAWMDKHYRDIFSEVKFAGIWDADHPVEMAINMTKAGLAKDLRADYLVDDQPKHCNAVAELGIKAVLFGDYPWNQDAKLHEHVARARSWQALEEYFDGLGS